MIGGEKEPKEMSDFSNAFPIADIAYRYTYTHSVVCI